VNPRIGIAGLALATGVAVAACGSVDNLGVATPTAAGPTVGPLATASAQAPASFGPPPNPTGDDAAPVTIDNTLLALLPEKIGTAPVQEDPDAAAAAVNDPALDQLAISVDSAVAVDSGNGDLVLANIVRLKPGAFGAEIYRQWRDSFDEGACSATGGVIGHAEAQIGGRQAYVTSCEGGMHTYHVWIEDQDLLISASSIGDGRFGEQLLNGLRLP
jgi:hypothetical protein